MKLPFDNFTYPTDKKSKKWQMKNGINKIFIEIH